MYGVPAWGKGYDYYRGKKWMRRIDFSIGFFLSAGLWYWLFKPVWYTAPAIITSISVVGFIFNFQRRYIFYGALCLIFFPLMIPAALLLLEPGEK